MKIFEKGGKVNFVDGNNVILGYDITQDCCEYADWFISKEITPYKYNQNVEDIDLKESRVEDYFFDPGFFKDISDSSDIEEGGIVVFKIIAKDQPDLYIHILNSHNGYYGHGFLFCAGDEELKEGVL